MAKTATTKMAKAETAKGETKSSRKAPADSAKYTKPALRDRLKREIQAGDKGGRKGQWSARKAQLLAHAYETHGGGYRGGKGEGKKHLDKWTDEKWQTKDGDALTRQDGATQRYLPKKAWDELTPAERRKTDAKKQAASRKGKQFVPNTPKAKAAGSRARGTSPAKQKASRSAGAKRAAGR